MGIGILLLKATGKENIILTKNPNITFFKKVFKKKVIYLSNISLNILNQLLRYK